MACTNSYSPPGPEPMGPSYSARTVVTYQTHIEAGHPMRSHLGTWGPGTMGSLQGPGHCKWEDRDGSVGELETRIKGGKGGLVSSGIPGEPGYYIPDQTLAQLTVKELNKRVQNLG